MEHHSYAHNDSSNRDERILKISQLKLEPLQSQRTLFKGITGSYRSLWDHRGLLLRLTGRELKIRYKDSSLGVVWSLFRPLVQLFIYVLIIGNVLGAARSVPDFAVFVLIGLSIWTLYSEILTKSTMSILDNAGLVKKVSLPREIFTLSAVGTALVNFGVQLLVLLIAITFFSNFKFSIELWLFPFSIASVTIFATAIGLLLAAANVYFRDTQHLLEIYLAVFFWVSPIVYPYTMVASAANGVITFLYCINPLTISVISAQRALWSAGAAPESAQMWPTDLPVLLLGSLILSTVLLFFAQRIFDRVQGNFAQEI